MRSVRPGVGWLVMSLCAGMCCRCGAAERPLALSVGPHLFIDDYLIEHAEGLVYTVHHPTRPAEPIIGGQSSPDACMAPYCTVIRDPQSGKFRLWYNVASEYRFDVAYMESEDGENWARPHRVVLETNGYDAHVIDDGPSCPDPERRFKLAYWEQLDDPSIRYTNSQAIGMCVAFSPDGIQWTKRPDNPVLPELWHLSPEVDPNHIGDPGWKQSSGDIVDVVYDPIKARYLACVKSYTQPPEEFGPVSRTYEYGRRLVSQTTSEDFVHWTTPRRIIVPDEQDEGDIEFYGMLPTVRGDLYLGFLRVLRDDVEEGIGYTVLATSRDGESWTRQREPFIDHSAGSGGWDQAVAWIGDCVTVGDEEFVYWGGYAAGHKAFSDRTLGLGKLRKNGFVSRDATGDEPGMLLTHLLSVKGAEPPELWVNAEAGSGELRVQVRNAGGEVMRGFSFGECRPLKGDGVAQRVRWKRALSELKGKAFRLEFRLRNGRLYGFSFAREM